MSLAIKASQARGRVVGKLRIMRCYSLIYEQPDFIIFTPQSQRNFPELDICTGKKYNNFNYIGQFVTILSVNKTRI